MINAPIAALFPGQGSQYPGMTKSLRENFPFIKDIFEEGSEAVKENLLKLCEDGPSDTLQLTHNAQPCILLTSYCWFQVLKRNLDFAPQAGAGHSLGEYSALLSSGALTVTEAVRLVRKRGELMQQAVPAGKGKMAAVLGLDDSKIQAVCQAATEGESVVVPANFNAPGQTVIAGSAEAVDRFIQLASGQTNPEWKARKVIPLNVSAPFHCPLMKETALKFVPFLEAVQWKEPAFPVVSNLDASLRSHGSFVPVLRDQIDHPVLWTGCGETLSRHGIKHFIEMGPGRVLVGLMKRIVDGATLFSLDSLEDFQAFEKEFK